MLRRNRRIGNSRLSFRLIPRWTRLEGVFKQAPIFGGGYANVQTVSSSLRILRTLTCTTTCEDRVTSGNGHLARLTTALGARLSKRKTFQERFMNTCMNRHPQGSVRSSRAPARLRLLERVHAMQNLSSCQLVRTPCASCMPSRRRNPRVMPVLELLPRSSAHTRDCACWSGSSCVEDASRTGAADS